jgi:enoyl-CoA hydratase/carnithine racemase
VSGPGRIVDDVLRIDDGAVTTLTLHRPEVKNALDRALVAALAGALGRAAADDDVRVVVLTGAGDAFSAGADLREAPDVDTLEERRAGHHAFLSALETFPKPLVAAVNGVAVGAGCTILLHCDLVLMADTARVRLPFVALGLTAEAGSSVLLPALVGHQEAAAMLLTGGWMGAAQAGRSGLAWKVCPPDALAADARAVAEAIAEHPLESLVATKRLLLAARVDAVRAAREREQREYDALIPAAAQRLRRARGTR